MMDKSASFLQKVGIGLELSELLAILANIKDRKNLLDIGETMSRTQNVLFSNYGSTTKVRTSTLN
jgi:hypothetical protein